MAQLFCRAQLVVRLEVFWGTIVLRNNLLEQNITEEVYTVEGRGPGLVPIYKLYVLRLGCEMVMGHHEM